MFFGEHRKVLKSSMPPLTTDRATGLVDLPQTSERKASRPISGDSSCSLKPDRQVWFI